MSKKVLILLCILLFIFIPTVFASDYSIIKYNIDAEILENGDMKVKEELKYDFDDDMNGLYRELLYSYLYEGQKDNLEPASKRYQASKVEDLKVYYSNTSFENMKEAVKEDESKLSNGMDGYYSVESVRSGESKDIIKVYTPVKEGRKKYVRYEYILKDVVVNYNDYAEIYWNFIGGSWQTSLSNITVNVHLPVETNIKAYYHTYGDVSSFRNDGKNITLKIPYLYSEVAADIRAVFPNNILRASNISKTINEDYDFDSLEKVENYLYSNIENYKVYQGIFGLEIIITPVIILIVILCSGNVKDGRIKNIKKAEIYMDILDNYTLYEYFKIYNNYNSILNGNLMIATIMDLSVKKVLIMNARKKIDKNKDKYEYLVSLNKNYDFNKLSEFEKIIINYIFYKKDSNKIDRENITDEEFELNERFKELSNKTSLAEKIRKRLYKIENEYKDKYYSNAKRELYKPVIIISIIVFLVFIIPIFTVCPQSMRTGFIFGSVFASLFVLTAGAIKVSVAGITIKSEYVDEYNRLKGLNRYLDEYSLLKDRYPIEVNLWEKYMVFACLFGIARKVAKEFKEELVLRGMSEDEIYSYYPYMYMGNHYSSYSSGISQATYAGTASSSSGGYSGGGGGGRRRRRRRRFLKYKKEGGSNLF